MIFFKYLSLNNLLEMKIKIVENKELFEKLNSYLKVFNLLIAHSNDITEIEIK